MLDLLFCFFFFKQKTAYEMRISDWSSDVCSSDLKGAIHPPRDIVPRGDRQESARVVVEADTIVEARGLGNALAEAAHPLGAVVEPPRRTDPTRGIMARQRRQLARIPVLVEREVDAR